MINPCQPGALFCRPIYNQDDYQCVCKPGFTGKNCETGKLFNIGKCAYFALSYSLYCVYA